MIKRLGSASFVILLVVGNISAFRQDPRNRNGVDGTILIGRNYSFILREPAGWLLDGTSGKAQGVDTVIYREGESWKTGVAVMYARVIPKDSKERETIQKVIENDVNEFKKANQMSRVSELTPLTTRDKKNATVKDFYDAGNKNFETVAYIDEPKVVIIIVLTVRQKEDFDKAFPAFKDLVGSYFFVQELSPN